MQQSVLQSFKARKPALQTGHKLIVDKTSATGEPDLLALLLRRRGLDYRNDPISQYLRRASVISAMNRRFRIVERRITRGALDTIAKSKIGTDNEEFIPGMVAAAVPVTDESGKLLATLATHGPVVRMSFEQAMAHVPRLQQAAQEIAASFE